MPSLTTAGILLLAGGGRCGQAASGVDMRSSMGEQRGVMVAMQAREYGHNASA